MAVDYDMNWTRLLISAITNGIISAGGILIASITGENHITDLTWILCGAWFCVSAAKDVQAHLAKSPRGDD